VDNFRNPRHLQISDWRRRHGDRIPIQLDHCSQIATFGPSQCTNYSGQHRSSSGSTSAGTVSSLSTKLRLKWLPTTSSPHSSPTPSTSGTRPKQTPFPKAQNSQPDPSGASTSGTTPQPPAAKAHNLRQRSKVNYKDLNTGASQFGRAEFRKRCSRAGASVRKSVSKVRKMSLAELFQPISQNSWSSSTAPSK
jgi:hypothetical protein